MKPLKNKLRQRSGASMIIALVFLMFCVFVGGAVLAAATANGARVQRKAADDQEYLTLRSAASLLIDELRPTVRKGTRLSVMTATTESYDNGEDADPVTKTTVSYSLTENRTELRELAYLCAACKYQPSSVMLADNTDFSAFTRFGRAPSTAAMAASGSPESDFSMMLTLDEEIVPITARMVCDSNYNISVFFLTEEGAVSDKLHIEMNTSYLEVTDEALQVVWNEPVIVKGGSAE